MPDSELDVSRNQLNIVAPDKMNTSDGRRRQTSPETAKNEPQKGSSGEHDSADGTEGPAISDARQLDLGRDTKMNTSASSTSPHSSPKRQDTTFSTLEPVLSEGEDGENSNTNFPQSTSRSSSSSAETTIKSVSGKRGEDSQIGGRQSYPYEIDFMYRKRDAVKRSSTHDLAELHFANLSRRFSFLWAGCASLLTISIRG